MNTTITVATKYSIFAVIATVANIGTQDISIRLYPHAYGLALSIFLGTVIGLIVKYILDKRYIFQYVTKSAAHNTQTFMLYTLMGIFTTVIFWGFEYAFHYAWESKEMRYLGGIIGLAIGYCTKYYLDKQFVFRKDSLW